MCNIYITSETEHKLKNVYSNIKSFFILDAELFIKRLGLDMSKPSSIFIANDEIQSLIISQAKLRKFKGVIYINKHISIDLINSFKTQFKNENEVKFILIDNGQFPKYTDIMEAFDEVIFYERFKKNKIVACDGFDKDNGKIITIKMDELNEDIS